MTPTEAAYLAGIIDGEGCISVQQQVRRYGIHLIVVQKDPVIIDWLVSHCGGRKTSVTRKSWGDVRTYWRWCLNTKADIVETLESVLPYLVMKRERARIALEIAATILDGGRGWKPTDYRTRGKAGRPRSLPASVLRKRARLLSQLNAHSAS